MHPMSSNRRGVGFLVLAMLIFSLQDIAVKWIGGQYPVLEIVVFRSVVAVPLTLLLFRYEGGRGLPTTKRHTLEYVRGVFYFLSYTTYFMGLAALPLAEIAAIKFLGPLMITVLAEGTRHESGSTQRTSGHSHHPLGCRVERGYMPSTERDHLNKGVSGEYRKRSSDAECQG
jgi:drug/metabolite transporter (DMT)-like permease